MATKEFMLSDFPPWQVYRRTYSTEENVIERFDAEKERWVIHDNDLILGAFYHQVDAGLTFIPKVTDHNTPQPPLNHRAGRVRHRRDSMSLQLTLTSLDGLHESLHDLYAVQEDGTYNLKPPEGFVAADSVEDVTGLKSALQKERDASREAARKLKATQEKYGAIDPEKYQSLLDQEHDAEQKRLEKAGEWEKMREQMSTQHAKDIQKERDEAARLRGQLEHVQIDSKVVEAISKAEGNVELLKPHVRSRLQLNPEDFTTVVLDSDGRTPKVDGDGNPVTIDTLISEMRKSDTYAGAFKATTQSGSGSDPAHGGDGPTAQAKTAGSRKLLETCGFLQCQIEKRSTSRKNTASTQ
jgi:hypothetical protein